MVYTKFRSSIYKELKDSCKIFPMRIYGGKTFFAVEASFTLHKEIQFIVFCDKPLAADFVLDYLLGRMLIEAADKYDMNVSYSEICDDFKYSVDASALDDSPYISFQLSEKEYEL